MLRGDQGICLTHDSCFHVLRKKNRQCLYANFGARFVEAHSDIITSRLADNSATCFD